MNIKPERNPDLNPVDFYNKFKINHAINIWLEKDKVISRDESDELAFSTKLNGSDEIVKFSFINGTIKIQQGTLSDLQPDMEYTPFMILVKFKFGGNHIGAYSWVNMNFFNAHIPYLRVGIDYFKKINKPDRFSINRTEIKRWKKEEIKEDHGKSIIKNIPRFDGFIMEPDNKNYQPVIHGNFYNMYSEFSHKPKEGDWPWTEILLRQVFNSQYELGLKYLQVLYLHPKQALPILVLASRTRSTGKTTFLNWLNQIFGANMSIISPIEITGSFNSSYAFSNIIGIEETVSDKKQTVEKLKALATNKFININQKYIDNYKMPFFAKFIITTNEENKFLKVDQEEIRFWVKKLPEPKIINTNIENDVINEIPAFLNYLEQMPDVDFKQSRMIFTPEEIRTDTLDIVKKESKPWLYKEIRELMVDWFSDNEEAIECYATPVDIKNQFFMRNSRVEANYIRTVLKDHFNMIPLSKPDYKEVFKLSIRRMGRFYTFKRNDFETY